MRKGLLLICLFLLPISTAHAEEKVKWYSSFDQALADARKDSKPIFMDVYTDWCTWCLKLDKDVYSTPQWVQFMQGFIPVRLNAEDNKDGSRVADKYSIDGFPTLLVTDGNGTVTNRIGGYMEADALIQDIDGIQQLISKEAKDPADVETAYRLGQEYLSRDMYPQAEKRFSKVLQSAQISPLLQEQAQFSVAMAQFYQHELSEALASLEKYEATYKDGTSEEDALLLLSQIHIEMDANEKARDDLKLFLQKYPNSGNAGRAQEVLATLEKNKTK